MQFCETLHERGLPATSRFANDCAPDISIRLSVQSLPPITLTMCSSEESRGSHLTPSPSMVHDEPPSSHSSPLTTGFSPGALRRTHGALGEHLGPRAATRSRYVPERTYVVVPGRILDIPLATVRKGAPLEPLLRSDPSGET